MTKEEWLVDFQVLNGRVPTEAEIAAAAQNGFAQAVPQAVPAKPSPFESSLVLKIAVGLVVAIFGYVVGYLFM